MIENVTKEYILDEDNLGQCECGNWAPHEYLTEDTEGCSSCPSCQISHMSDMIGMYKDLVRKMADPKLTKKDIDQNIKMAICELLSIDEDYFERLEIEI